ncbi:MAG: YqgE/AlgH family protein [Myxococcales bacterium]
MSELAPGFLVAMPQLGDPNFQRAVVLILEHGEGGAMGLVINRPAPISLSQVARDQGYATGAGYEKAPVFIGGPVEPERGFVLHDRKDLPEAMPIVDGLCVSGSIESLKVLLQGPPDRFRLCLGYAGWGPGQLESELREGAWLAASVSRQHVLSTPPALAWEAVIRGMGIDPARLQLGGGLH